MLRVCQGLVCTVADRIRLVLCEGIIMVEECHVLGALSPARLPDWLSVADQRSVKISNNFDPVDYWVGFRRRYNVLGQHQPEDLEQLVRLRNAHLKIKLLEVSKSCDYQHVDFNTPVNENWRELNIGSMAAALAPSLVEREGWTAIRDKNCLWMVQGWQGSLTFTKCNVPDENALYLRPRYTLRVYRLVSSF